MCFLYSIIAFLHPAKDNVNRVSNYNKEKYINELNIENINFSPSLDDINKLIKQNPEIEINVFELNDNIICPIKITND